MPTPEEHCREHLELLEAFRRLLRRFEQFEALRDGNSNPAAKAVPAVVSALAQGVRFRVESGPMKGGVGEVYAARDEMLGRQVALKFLRRDKGGPLAERDFRREVMITALLQHPGVVPVFGPAQGNDGRSGYAMRFIEGGSLDGAIARHFDVSADEKARPTRKELLDRFVAVCNTMAYSHSRGVIHRDLKPLNIMLGKYNETFVVDWGMGKVIGRADPEETADAEFGVQPSSEDKTAFGVVKGTYAYMPPEQARGEIHFLDERVDVFALGAVLCKILTGLPPYTGSTIIEVYQKAQKAELESCFARLDSSDADPELISLAKRCMEKTPADRPRNAQAVLDAIRAHQAAVEARAREEHERRMVAEAKAAEEKKRRQVATALAAEAEKRAQAETRAKRRLWAVIGVILVGVAVSGYLGWMAKVEARRARRQSIDLAWNQGRELCLRGDPGQGLLFLVRALELAEDNEPGLAARLRQDIAAWESQVNHLIQIFDRQNSVTTLAICPRGEILITAGADGHGYLWNLASGKEIGRIQFEQEASTAIFSPDGLFLLVGSRLGKAELWDVTAQKRVWSIPAEGVQVVAFSPNGETLLTGNLAGKIELWECQHKQKHSLEALTIRDQPTPITGAAFSPDGKKIIATNADGWLSLWDAATGKHLCERKAHSAYAFLAMLPKQNLMLTVGQDKVLQTWTGDTLDWTGYRVSVKEDVAGLSADANGERVLLWSRAAARVWNLQMMREEGQPLRNLQGLNAAIMAPLGGAVLTAGLDGSVRKWALRPRVSPTRLASSGNVIRAGFSHNAEMIWTIDDAPPLGNGNGDQESTIHLWRSATGDKRADLCHNRSVTSATFNNDSSLLATGLADGKVSIWSLANMLRSMVFSLRLKDADQDYPVWTLAFDREGRNLASCDEAKDLSVHDLNARKTISSRHVNGGRTTAMAFDPAGRWLISGGSDKVLRRWDAAIGSQLEEQTIANEAASLRFNIHGNLLLVGTNGSEGRLAIYGCDGSGLKLRCELDHGEPINSVAFKPADDRLFVTAGGRTAQFWLTESGQPLGPKLLHPEPIVAASFDKYGGQLFTLTFSGELRAWTVPNEANGTPMSIRRHVERITGQELGAGEVIHLFDKSTWLSRSDYVVQ